MKNNDAAVNAAVFLPVFFNVQSGMIPLLKAGLTWVAAIMVSRTRLFRQEEEQIHVFKSV